MSINNNNNNSSEKEESEEERRERERLEYNKYVIEDRIHERIDSMIQKKIREAVLDKVYSRTRLRIRQKGGLVKHDDAMRWVVSTQSQQIREEIIDDAINGLAEFQPLLAENLRSKDPKTREDAQRVLNAMMEAAE